MPDTLPSCYQIRYGGYKGTLALTPDDQMKEKDIIFRESMKKFECSNDVDHRVLEIIDFSKPSNEVTCNSEIINILNGCCTNKPILLDYFHESIDNFLNLHSFLLLNTTKAKEFYKECNDYYSLRALDMGFSLDKAFLIGFYRLKLKKLQINLKDSCRLFGIADFSRTLNEKEIFIKNNGKVITGQVILFREPCYLASDLQIFTAVDVLCLNYLDNVIVFSTNSKKCSDSSLMSGSDLDGDKFVCIWNQTLVENILVNNFEINFEVKPLNFDFNFNESDSVFDKMRKSCFYIANNSLKYCSLKDLLYLRDCYIDKLDNKWASNDDLKKLGKFLTSTVDAPKSCNWVEVNKIEELYNNRPALPKFHKNARLFNSSSSEDSLQFLIFSYIHKWLENKFSNFDFNYNDGLYRDYIDISQIIYIIYLSRDFKKHIEKYKSKSKNLHFDQGFYSTGYWKINDTNIIKHIKKKTFSIKFNTEQFADVEPEGIYDINLLNNLVEKNELSSIFSTSQNIANILWIFRTIHSLNPQYSLNYFVSKEYSRILINILNFRNPLIQLSETQNENFENENRIIKYFYENPPKPEQTTYGLKHIVEKAIGNYVSEEQAKEAIKKIGYGITNKGYVLGYAIFKHYSD